MRRSTVLNLRKFKILETIIKNKILLLLCMCFSLGIIISTAIYNKNETVSVLASQMFNRFFDTRSGASFGAVVIGSASVSLLYLIAVYISGTSMLGIVLVPLIVFIRGFFDGSLSALLYTQYALKGIAFNAVLIIPPSIIFLVGFIYAAQESVNFSWTIANLTLPRSSPATLFASFRGYCTRFSLILIVVLFSSLADAVVSRFFLPFFNI